MLSKIPFSIKLAGLIVIVPIVEILLLYVSSWIFGGWFWPIVFMVISGVLGCFIARRQGMKCWNELNSRLDKKEVPTETILHGVMIFFAGLFLIIPGFLSDILGLLLLIPPCRSAAISTAVKKFQAYREKIKRTRKGSGSNRPPDEDVIDI